MFQNDLVRRRRDSNMQKLPNFEGIQNARQAQIQQTQGFTQMNPLMPDFSSDNTKTATTGGNPQPGFMPHMNE